MKVNQFQEAKKLKKKLIDEGYNIAFDFGIGQPSGGLSKEAQLAFIEAVRENREAMCVYQDNECAVEGFSKEFVQYHAEVNTSGFECFPIPGIKPMLEYVVLAARDMCGEEGFVVASMYGYDTPQNVTEDLGIEHISIQLDENFDICNWEELKRAKLIMCNYPHNPSGKALTIEEGVKLCSFCEDNDILLFNDAAYAGLMYNDKYFTLIDASIVCPNLEIIELYSASKNPHCGNATSLRAGAGAGTKKFVEYFLAVKGRRDSGLCPFAAAAVLGAIRSDIPKKVAQLKYKNRIEGILRALDKVGLKVAYRPETGFFLLLKVPKIINGEEIGTAAKFNEYLIKTIGAFGIAMPTPWGIEYLRWSVAGVDTSTTEFEEQFLEACKSIKEIIY